MANDSWTPTGDNWIKSSEAAILSGLSVRKIKNLAYNALPDGENRYNDIFLKHPKYPLIYVHKLNFFAKYTKTNTKIDLEFKVAYQKALNKIYSNNAYYLIEDLKIITDMPLKIIKIYIKYYDSPAALSNSKKALLNAIKNILNNPKKYSFYHWLKNTWITTSEADKIKNKNYNYAKDVYTKLKKTKPELASKMFKKIGSRLLINRELWKEYRYFVNVSTQEIFEDFYYKTLALLDNNEILLLSVLHQSYKTDRMEKYSNIYHKIKYNFPYGTEKTTVKGISKLNDILQNQKNHILKENTWITTSEADKIKNKDYYYANDVYTKLKKTNPELASRIFKKLGFRLLVNKELWEKYETFNEDTIDKNTWITTSEADKIKNKNYNYVNSIKPQLKKTNPELVSKMFKKVGSRLLVNRELWDKHETKNYKRKPP